jgi:hypothetical protein
MRRVLLALLVAGLLTASFAIPTRLAAGQETGAVVFAIILIGPVDPSDAFGLQVLKDECCFSEQVTPLCGAEEAFFDPECTDREYTLRFGAQPVGTELRYALLRWPGSIDNDPEIHLSGSVIVPDGETNVRLTYVYPGVPLLPNTALPPP